MPLETTAALRVDLLDPGAPQIIHAVQDDSDSRKIAFNIYAGGAQWAVPDGTLVTVRYKKPDGTAGFYDTLPDGSTPAATIDGNVVTVALVPQAFTVRGNVPVQIKLYNSTGASIATFAVVMHVSANVVSDAEIVSSDYYSVLTKQIADVLAAAEGIKSNVTAAQAAARQAASSASAAAGSAKAAAGSASTASTAAEQAQTAATDASQSETNAANSASDAEDAKTAAETAASSASDDATAAANAKTAAETAATNAEAAAKALEEFGDPVTPEHGGTGSTSVRQGLVVGGLEYLTQLGYFELWHGSLNSGSIVAPNAKKYPVVMISCYIAPGDKRTIALAPTGNLFVQVSTPTSSMVLGVTPSGTQDCEISIVSNPSGGRIDYVWGFCKSTD